MTGDGVGFQLDLPVIQIKGLLRRLGQDTGGKGRPAAEQSRAHHQAGGEVQVFPFHAQNLLCGIFVRVFLLLLYHTGRYQAKNQAVRLFFGERSAPHAMWRVLALFTVPADAEKPLDVADHAFWPLGGGHGPDRFAMSLQPLR